MRIAYEAAAETAKSTDDSSKPSGDTSDEASKERPWAKLDGIVARWAQQREAAMKAAAEKHEAGAMEAEVYLHKAHDSSTDQLLIGQTLKQLSSLPFPDQLAGSRGM